MPEGATRKCPSWWAPGSPLVRSLADAHRDLRTTVQVETGFASRTVHCTLCEIMDDEIPWMKLCYVSAGFTSCCQPSTWEACEQLAKIILVGAGSTGVKELELAGAVLKGTLRGLVALACEDLDCDQRRLASHPCATRAVDDPLIEPPVHTQQHTDETPVELSVVSDGREASAASSTVSTECSQDGFRLLPWLHALCVAQGNKPPKNFMP